MSPSRTVYCLSISVCAWTMFHNGPQAVRGTVCLGLRGGDGSGAASESDQRVPVARSLQDQEPLQPEPGARSSQGARLQCCSLQDRSLFK